MSDARRLNDLVLRRLPALSGAIAFAIGVVNLVSAVTPNLSWRGHVLLTVLPARVVPLFHTVAVPASVALIVCSFDLHRRRRRAWAVAFGLLVTLGALNIVKGLDVEEALLSWAGAAVLWFGREYFCVEHARMRALRLLAPILAASAAGVALLVWLASGRDAREGPFLRQTIALFAFTHDSLSFRDELGWLPLAVAALTVVLIVMGEWMFFRPRPAPRTLPDEAARRRVRDLIRAHGTDTLAFFKLRRDLHYLFYTRRARLPRLPDRERRARRCRAIPSVRPVRSRRSSATPAASRKFMGFGSRRSVRARGSLPVWRGLRPARDLHRRRGHRPHVGVHARGPRDPQGETVRASPRARGLHGRGRARSRSSTRPR